MRLYEDWGLISKPLRQKNGYRVFTNLHIDQIKVARTAFEIEILQNGLRKKAISIVKQSALQKFDDAIKLTDKYICLIQTEIGNADEAVKITNNLLTDKHYKTNINYTRKEVSILLNISMDTLRNWEMNGLLSVRRKENGYRVYIDEDINKLKIIRSLKCANYSLSAILRMLNAISTNPSANANIHSILNTPQEHEDIISACDKLIVSLNHAMNNAFKVKAMLVKMNSKYSNPPL